MKKMDEINKILIVDDSGTARMIIKQCFKIAGCHDKKFFEAKNGLEALELIKSTKIDLLVTDLNMPIMDGKQLLMQLNKEEQYRGISTLVITSSSNEAKEMELKSLGADIVINKPIKPAHIFAVLQGDYKGVYSGY